MSEELKTEIMRFINHFTFNGRFSEVIDSFTCGNCYWFAYILYERFADLYPEIVYDLVENHFATAIRGRVFDITGDVTDQYTWVDWDKLDDPLLKEHVTRDCIKFLEDDV